MPANYTGNATGVQAPAVLPAAGIAPVLSIPLGTDVRSIESISQAMKVLADYITYLQTLLSGQSPLVSSNLPQLLLKDSIGNPRFLVSHNGFPGGSINAFREEWKLPLSPPVTAAGVVTANPLWFLTVAGAPLGFSTLAPSVTMPNTAAAIVPSNVTNNKVIVASNGQWMHPGCTFASWELKADFGMDNIGANGMTYWFGFSGAKDVSSPASGFIWFKKATGDTNWQCQTNDGTTTTTIDSGVVPGIDGTTGGTMQRLRIEYHGSATPYAANTARFFLNDVLVGTSTTNLPTATQYIVFGGFCTAAGSAHDCEVGTIELNVNRFAVGAST